MVSMVTSASRSPHTNEWVSWLTTNSESSSCHYLQSSRSISADDSNPVWFILWEVLVLAKRANKSKWLVVEVVGERRCGSSCRCLGYASTDLWNGLSLCHGFLTVSPGNLCPGYILSVTEGPLCFLIIAQMKLFCLKCGHHIFPVWHPSLPTAKYSSFLSSLKQFHIMIFC